MVPRPCRRPWDRFRPRPTARWRSTGSRLALGQGADRRSRSRPCRPSQTTCRIGGWPSWPAWPAGSSASTAPSDRRRRRPRRPRGQFAGALPAADRHRGGVRLPPRDRPDPGGHHDRRAGSPGGGPGGGVRASCVNAGGTRQPIYMIHAYLGTALSYRRLGPFLSPDRPLVGIQVQEFGGRSGTTRTSVEQMAEEAVDPDPSPASRRVRTCSAGTRRGPGRLRGRPTLGRPVRRCRWSS